MDALTVRFDEWTRYDPRIDAEVICLLGITGRGTYHHEHARGLASANRAKRKAFAEQVVRLMDEGVPPGEVELG